MMNKKTILVGAIVAALGAGAIGVGTTLAAEAGNRSPEFVSGLVSAIAEKFDLDPTAVQEVFDEEAQSRRAERQAKRGEIYEQRLAKAVENGKLAQDQADALILKRDETQEYAETLKDMGNQERMDAMKEKVGELKDWADENDIPAEFIRFGPPPHDGRGQGIGRGFGNGNRMGGGEMPQSELK